MILCSHSDGLQSPERTCCNPDVWCVSGSAIRCYSCKDYTASCTKERECSYDDACLTLRERGTVTPVFTCSPVELFLTSVSPDAPHLILQLDPNQPSSSYLQGSTHVSNVSILQVGWRTVSVWSTRTVSTAGWHRCSPRYLWPLTPEPQWNYVRVRVEVVVVVVIVLFTLIVAFLLNKFPLVGQ